MGTEQCKQEVYALSCWTYDAALEDCSKLSSSNFNSRWPCSKSHPVQQHAAQQSSQPLPRIPYRSRMFLRVAIYKKNTRQNIRLEASEMHEGWNKNLHLKDPTHTETELNDSVEFTAFKGIFIASRIWNAMCIEIFKAPLIFCVLNTRAKACKATWNSISGYLLSDSRYLHALQSPQQPHIL